MSDAIDDYNFNTVNKLCGKRTVTFETIERALDLSPRRDWDVRIQQKMLNMLSVTYATQKSLNPQHFARHITNIFLSRKKPKSDTLQLMTAMQLRAHKMARTILRSPKSMLQASLPEQTYTLLHCAIDHNAPIDIAKKIIKLFPEMVNTESWNQQKTKTFTPLLFAVIRMRENYAELLVANGAVVDKNLFKQVLSHSFLSIKSLIKTKNLLITLLPHIADVNEREELEELLINDNGIDFNEFS